ncbi:hypothetical protein PC116_g14009 [Phytophthora cactorum]|uniref:Uncharacterized protein n=1 Tax=Phytophthora cactorum TaxID=29920 RepID=A0A8T1KR89_9STRA|nr:hypothetical protein Pcac1_g9569 [Phytophthora cactorum]KAG2908229.1 hypothetical protein PC117_g20016 [Phytophthora cactorum]KAG2987122.1 hypothetical protein PC119_g19759 [Phytophthora cactorum]KAG3016703.1 hypothetical protein PC120_g11473 [Phytophthora cactorum]KAG3125658.1 hypothetical protein C6341_g25694 [Phytophthora cactorum]
MAQAPFHAALGKEERNSHARAWRYVLAAGCAV